MTDEDASVVEDVIMECGNFLRTAYGHTSYDDQSQDGKELFHSMLVQCQKMDEEGLKMIRKFEPLAASTASKRVQYRAMIKVAWRFIKSLQISDHQHEKLRLLVVSLAALTVGARNSGAKVVQVDKWRDQVARWFGEQLTIGGKGVTGAGEGSASDRATRFFNTPYLHDFD